MTDESYDEEAEVWRYIGRWYNHLFTDDERILTAQRLQELVPEASPSEIEAVLAESHGGKAESRPAVRRLLSAVDDLTRNAIDRICREHAETLSIKRCPACHRIVASPAAKQCLWCGYDWHSAADNVVTRTAASPTDRDAT
jgi:hypothetical protein